jgi:DNA-binding beta-propeller fold protein YncE
VKNFQISLALLAVLGTISLRASSAEPPTHPPSYHLLKEIPIGGEGGWDYLSVDESGNRLFVSHGTRAVVIDLNSGTVSGEITDTPGIHGVAFSHDKAFTSNGKENTVSIHDLKTLRPLGKVDAGKNPDCILYVPSTGEVWAFNGKENTATVLDARSGSQVTTVKLPGKPEFAVLNPKDGMIYLNIQDHNDVAVIDPSKHTVLRNFSIAPAEDATGIDVDPETGRIFVVSHNKGILAMFDGPSGSLLATAPIGKGVDGVCFDRDMQNVFTSNGEGSISIVHVDGPDHLRVVQTLNTLPGTRTMTLDPKTHRIYLSAATLLIPKNEDPKAEHRWVREKIQPDSFRVLVYGPES